MNGKLGGGTKYHDKTNITKRALHPEQDKNTQLIIFSEIQELFQGKVSK